MDEIWERAVITALDGQRDAASVRALTLDGAVKCLQGRLPAPSLLERFENIQHLSIANTGVSSLQHFPRLGNLQKLILSDNRIAGGLEFLVEAGLDSLRDLDLSNNRIQYIEDLAPLAQLKLVSLDLYECPVTRAKDYRARVFGLVKSLKFLDKMDAEGSERLESDEEEDDEDEDEDDEYDPGSGEVDGEEDGPYNNGFNMGSEGVVDVDEDEESDADEEETDLSKRVGNGSSNHQANGFREMAVRGGDDEGNEGEDEDNSGDSGEEIDEEDGDEDVAEVHEVEGSDDDGEFDALEVDDDVEDDDEVNEEVDNEESDLPAPGVSVRLGSIEGVIDGHEHGEEEGAEDDNGETGEEEPLDDDGDFDEEEEEDYGADYLVLPVGQAEEDGYVDLENVTEDLEEEEEVEDVQELPSSSSLHLKRKRGGNGSDDNDDDDDDDDDSCDDDSEDDDIVDQMNSSSKKQR